MTIIGIDAEHSRPHGYILNSWGPNTHGILKDFETGEILPAGLLRVDMSVIDFMLRQNDSFAYSAFDGFDTGRSGKLKKEEFKLL